MERERKIAPASEAPLCARLAHQQLERGTSAVFLPGQVTPLSDTDIDLLRFLAACDDDSRHEALTVWGALQDLAGERYERAASVAFLSVAMRPPNYAESLIRAELEDADNAVADAAERLRDALLRHPYLGTESAALNWPAFESRCIADGLRGLHGPSSWDRKGSMVADAHAITDAHGRELQSSSGSDTAGDAEPPLKLQENVIFSSVLSLSPTTLQMTAVLARRARESSKRSGNTKAQGPTKIGAYAQCLSTWLVSSFPNATAHHLAAICIPVIAKRFYQDKLAAFDLCWKMIDDVKKAGVI